MKNKQLEPLIIVSQEKLEMLSVGALHFIEIPLDEYIIGFLPPPYESADHTMLVFPAKECPEWIYFKVEGTKAPIIGRKILNAIAYKLENGNEIIKIHLK